METTKSGSMQSSADCCLSAGISLYSADTLWGLNGVVLAHTLAGWDL